MQTLQFEAYASVGGERRRSIVSLLSVVRLVNELLSHVAPGWIEPKVIELFGELHIDWRDSASICLDRENDPFAKPINLVSSEWGVAL